MRALLHERTTTIDLPVDVRLATCDRRYRVPSPGVSPHHRRGVTLAELVRTPAPHLASGSQTIVVVLGGEVVAAAAVADLSQHLMPSAQSVLALGQREDLPHPDPLAAHPAPLGDRRQGPGIRRSQHPYALVQTGPLPTGTPSSAGQVAERRVRYFFMAQCGKSACTRHCHDG